MKNIFALLIVTITLLVFAGQSVVIEVSGTSSMGDSKSRRETIDEAKANALKTASENASTFVSSETTIRDYITEKDLVEAFSQAVIRVLEEIQGEWFKDELMGDSYKITLKVEVTPKDVTVKQEKGDMMDSPSAPLTVKLWTENNRTEFKSGEKVSLYMKGNKPFFAKVIYVQADGTQVQILPNPFRKDNYFEGGAVYTLPSGKDQYDLTVGEPFGSEKIVVYASTSELGDVKVEDAGSVFVVNEKPENTGVLSRGIKLKKKESKSAQAAEFFEQELLIKTEK